MIFRLQLKVLCIIFCEYILFPWDQNQSLYKTLMMDYYRGGMYQCQSSSQDSKPDLIDACVCVRLLKYQSNSNCNIVGLK